MNRKALKELKVLSLVPEFSSSGFIFPGKEVEISNECRCFPACNKGSLNVLMSKKMM